MLQILKHDHTDDLGSTIAVHLDVMITDTRKENFNIETPVVEVQFYTEGEVPYGIYMIDYFKLQNSDEHDCRFVETFVFTVEEKQEILNYVKCHNLKEKS